MVTDHYNSNKNKQSVVQPFRGFDYVVPGLKPKACNTAHSEMFNFRNCPTSVCPPIVQIFFFFWCAFSFSFFLLLDPNKFQAHSCLNEMCPYSSKGQAHPPIPFQMVHFQASSRTNPRSLSKQADHQKSIHKILQETETTPHSIWGGKERRREGQGECIFCHFKGPQLPICFWMRTEFPESKQKFTN